MSIGQDYERRVQRWYVLQGFPLIRHDVRRRIRHPQGTTHGQLDLVYFSLREVRTRYVECKYRASERVGVDALGKFTAVLELLGIVPEQGDVVTNNGFTPRAELYAQSRGIQLYVVPYHGNQRKDR